LSDSVDKPARKVPRKVTPAYLQRAAMAYLERYASSSEQLRRVLTRKVANRCRLRGEDAAEFREAIEEVVAKSLRVGLVDDARYAQARVATLRRRGGSARAIQAKLSVKGVDRHTIAAALEGDDGDEENAARAFARRRRLGPYRVSERLTFRDKDLAAMGRAGFGFALAKRLVDGEIESEA
jgi:regulatory protein